MISIRGPKRRPSRPRPAGTIDTAKPGAPSDKATGAPPPPQHEQLPFDAAFFRTHFPALILKPRKRPRPATRAGRDFAVNVILGDGAVSLDVSHVEGITEQWALFAVFDDAGVNDSGETRYVFVPFGTIARVEVTALERHAGSIGFVVAGRARRRKSARRIAGRSAK